MSVLRQVFAVTAVGISTLAQRRGTALVIVAGVACVVGVLVSMLSVTSGLTRMYLAGSGQDLAIVLPKNELGEFGSGLSVDAVATILNAPGIAKGPDGAALADAEFVFSIGSPPGLIRDLLQIRGVGEGGTRLRDDFRIESGRMLRTGSQELIIGVGASRRFGLKTGDQLLMPGGFWPIVGTFSNEGDRSESEFFADVDTLRSATRKTGFGSVTVKLENPHAFDELQHWLTTNPAIAVDVYRVPDYLLRANGRQLVFFTRASYAIGIIMALGALFGATKIMYAAVRARTREIGTFRALGYGPGPVTISVLLEAVMLSLLGAMLGILLAWLVFNGREVYSGSVFRLHVSTSLMALGLGWGVAIALLGGALPAIRAGRLPTATALRAV
ncbi:MAG TPA: ABC transporter permease [Steroidobacteraceae bacterium]|jgi:putative ABC transport system permease protein|nr:ABC transporter permease [Steroidobacteraceae bacterium]